MFVNNTVLKNLNSDRPGKPTDNAFIEAFNGRFRQECLNENWFLSLEERCRGRWKLGAATTMARGPTAPWKTLSPKEFAALATMAD